MKVCKFGGSSLADAKQLTKVIDIVLADPQRRMVVVSAPGKRNKADTKVTDLLIALAQAALDGGDTAEPRRAVLARYASMAEDLGLGSCWAHMKNRNAADGTPADEVIHELLGIPDNLRVLCVIAVGHKGMERKPFNEAHLQWEKVHINKW